MGSIATDYTDNTGSNSHGLHDNTESKATDHTDNAESKATDHTDNAESKATDHHGQRGSKARITRQHESKATDQHGQSGNLEPRITRTSTEELRESAHSIGHRNYGRIRIDRCNPCDPWPKKTVLSV